MLRKIAALFLLSWLPLQGIAAVDMPFCEHTLSAHRHAGAEARAVHDHHHGAPLARPDDRHSATHAAPVAAGGSTPSAGDLGCNGCGACHLACAAAIPVALSTVPAVPIFDLTPPPIQALHAFTPQQPDPPPLA
jgi:ferredoxin